MVKYVSLILCQYGNGCGMGVNIYAL